jgi:hypothetical protein
MCIVCVLCVCVCVCVCLARGFHVNYDDAIIPENILQWNIKTLRVGPSLVVFQSLCRVCHIFPLSAPSSASLFVSLARFTHISRVVFVVVVGLGV